MKSNDDIGGTKRPNFRATPPPPPQSGTRSAQRPWPDPQPLHGKLLPVEKLQPEMIPEPLRAWCEDISHRMQCPLDYVGVAAVCMVSIVIGAGCVIRPKEFDDWPVVPNLWGGIVAPPSMLKTPSIDAAFNPLRRLEAKAREEYEAAMKAHDAKVAAYKAKLRAIEKKMEQAARGRGGDMAELEKEYAALQQPLPPVRKRYLTNDTTIQKASEIMSKNPRGIAIMRDELIGFLVILDKEERQEDRAFHLEAWNGYVGNTTDRIGRGTIDTPQLCTTVFGGIQPSKLYVYLALAKNNICNDGLLQRFQLLVAPDDPRGGVIDKYPNREAANAVFAVIEKLAAMDFAACGGETDEFTKTPYFHFTEDAQRFFTSWLVNHQKRLRDKSEEPIMVEHLSKFRSLMPSLALIFHLIETANGVEGWSVPIHCAQQAATWCKYLETHARRIYGLARSTSIQSARQLLKKIAAGALKDGFNARDVYACNWGLLDSRESAMAAINELIDTGWLRETPRNPSHGVGRPQSPTFRIHPRFSEFYHKDAE
jgi:hypothetical protein